MTSSDTLDRSRSGSRRDGRPRILRAGIRQIASRLNPHRRLGTDLSVLYVYRFCGLGGVETSTTTKLRAFAGSRVCARALFFEHYGVGSEELARLPEVLFGLETSEIKKLLREVHVVVVVDFPEFLNLFEESGCSAKIVFESHASYLPALSRFYGRLNSPSISAIVVPSRFNRSLMSRFGVTRDDVTVIPNPVDTKRFRPAKPRQFRSRIGSPPVPLVLWVGRLEDQKCPLEFLRIAVRLLREGHGFEFAMVGASPRYAESAEELREEIPPPFRDSFSFLCAVPPSEMPALYNVARVSGGCLVSTSLNESQPMILLEAMACRCPVVSSRVGGVPEIVGDGETGHLYDLGDDETAARAIVALADPRRRRLRESMTRQALAAVRARHDPWTVARHYRQLFDRIR